MDVSSEPTLARLFALPDFRALLATDACATLASRALAVVVGYQVYALTRSPLALGMLGLVEAIPALSLALYGGHVADRCQRRGILRFTLATLAGCGLALALLAASSHAQLSLAALYGVVFVAGVARGFAEPAAVALEAEVVPPELIVRSAPWFASTWLVCAIAGPVLGGYVFTAGGAGATYLLLAALYAGAWTAASRLPRRPPPPPAEHESVWKSIKSGVQYVVGEQILVGSMALDLFAVLFGGVIAILPVFAADILRVGPLELGFLNAAPNAGALLTMLSAAFHPPRRHAGRILLVAVAGFGVSMIVFALSRNFYLSLAVLAVSGVCDGISVVIRRSIVRLYSPEHLRGRIAAVSMIFIGSSNELGALESGLAASWLGTVPSVVAGGSLTLIVVAATALLAPRLRQLRLDQRPLLPPQPERAPDQPPA